MEDKFNSTTIPRRLNGTNLIRTNKIEQKLYKGFVFAFLIAQVIPILIILNFYKILNGDWVLMIYLIYSIIIMILLMLSLVLNFLYSRIINKNEYPYEHRRTKK